MTKKTNWNSRMKGDSSDKPTRKKNQGFITSSFRVEEVLDESGEVLEDTVIKFIFGGLIIYLSIANAIKMNIDLDKILKFKK